MKVIYIKGPKKGQVHEDTENMCKPLLDAKLVEVYKEPKEKFKELKAEVETKELKPKARTKIKK